MSSDPSPPNVQPPVPPPPPQSSQPPPQSGGSSGYDKMADKVGCLPSIRIGDNLASLVGAVIGLVVGCVVIAPLIGNVMPSAPVSIHYLFGGVIGVIAGVFLVGLILMIVGLCRR